MATAYSYLRFSSREQAKGDSIRRQAEATALWCERNRVALDESLSLRDEGVSAFKGKNRENPDVHGLAAFLKAVETGKITRGSYLILENLDRLTRESIVPAVNLFTSILLAGVKIVQLNPEQVFTSGAEITTIMLALVELSRGNSESRIKSERVGAAWANKQRLATTRPLTKRTPAWISLADGKLALDKDKAKTVCRLFAMAASGLGLSEIAAKLNAERVPLMGRTTFQGRQVVWSASLIHRIITSRATIGEYQPHRGRPGDRKPCGDPIPNYYPAVVEASTFHAAQAALHTRFVVGRGRRGRHIHLFAGLLKDARGGGSLICRHHSKRESVIFPADAAHGRGARWVSFPQRAFEQAVLSQLIEVKIADLEPSRPAENPAESLSARLAELDDLQRKWVPKMDNPELVDIVAQKLTEIKAERRSVAEKLREAEREASSPLADAIGQLKEVGKVLALDDSEENRTRCRGAIRRAVQSVWCLFTPGRGLRLAAVQVFFKGTDRQRLYVIAHRPAVKNGKGLVRTAKSEVLSDVWESSTDLPDLRKTADVKRLEKLLNSLDLDNLEL